MQCRSNKKATQKKINPNVPKRGSAGFWFHVIAFGFFLPLMFIGVPLTLIFCSWNISLFWVGPVIGLVCAFFIARKYHHKMMTMNQEEYADKFKARPIEDPNRFFPINDDSPFDAMSPKYWALGPGRNFFKDDE